MRLPHWNAIPPRLEKLTLNRSCFPWEEMNILVRWKANKFTFPRLQFLVLKHCESLEEIPFGIADNLQKIELHYCSSFAEVSARMIQEDQKKMHSRSPDVQIFSKELFRVEGFLEEKQENNMEEVAGEFV
ncbi:hypothetical protein ACH5RR_029785 [Cinchona calisaya]|uniref:Disease resistance protein n=1 Tax=Cinchona calisaya TaxID=153742 RepID=A0ABD2YVX4_9GENT